MSVIRYIVRFRRLLIAAIHLALVVLANYLAFWLRFDGDIPGQYRDAMLRMLPWLVAIRCLIFVPFRLYEGLWRYTSIWDLRNIIGGVFISTGVFYVLVHWCFGLTRYPRSVFIIDAILLVCLMGGIRLARRLYRELGFLERERRVLIYGAGDAGEMIVRQMRNDPSYECEPVGFVDDDSAKVGQRIHGVPVLGTRRDLPAIMVKTAPQEVLLAMPAAKPKAIRELVKVLEPYKVRITTLPSLRDLIAGKVALQEIRQLSLEDLLERTPVGLDPGPVRQLIEGKCVLVTGAGGSIGSELCRQIAAFCPRVLVLYERYENGLYTIATELADRHKALPVVSVVGDITDAVRVDAVLGEHQPEIVFHAAAHKHVPMMELNPCEAVKNNILGTRIMAEAAAHHGAERFVLISSDKAVNPSSIMGASKRVAERIVLDLSRENGTRFIVVRFGNVLGSSGSVVPRFREQIRAGGPVTVTHPEVYRYFMLTSEAVQLVLHAATQPKTGVLYVLEMGEPICLLEMARNVIRLSGFVPEEDIPIKFVGLRPGEKLFEDLVSSDEVAEPSGIEGILRIQPTSSIDPVHLREQVAKLEALAAQGDSKAAAVQLSEIVPTFVFQRGERRRRPPRYRAMLVRNTLPLVERCESVEGLRVLLEEVRKDLGFLTLQVRFKEEAAPAILNGLTEITVADPAPPKDPDLLRQNGVPSWTGRTEILCPMWNGECGMRNHSNAEWGIRNGAERREGSGGDKGTGRQGDRETSRVGRAQRAPYALS